MRKITIAHFYNKLILAVICVMGASLNSFGQCPIVGNPNQSFCDIDAPMVGNLIATNNGGGIKWYASATSTTPLSNTVGLVNNTDYYADDNTGACGVRQIVHVTIYGRPYGLDFQGVCVDDSAEATIADLFAVGNNIQWYNVPSGGTPLAFTTVLVDNTFYYVDQSNPDTGCRTSRRSVFVNVGVVPVPIGKEIQTFCGDSPSTVADLTASGTNNWYSTISSGSPLPLTTPLVHGESYYATTVDLPCESAERLQVTIEIIPPNDAGSNGEIEICETGVVSTNTVDLFDALIGSPDITGTWTGPLATSNNHIGTVDVTTMTAAESPYMFTYSVSSDACPTATATVSIIIIESGDPGTNGTLTLCNNSAAQDLFGSLGGTPEYGGTWSPALASGTGVFDPAQDAAGFYTYTVQGVPPCGQVTATVEVIVNPEPEPGTNGNLTLCFEGSPENLFNSLGGSPESGGTWTPALASGTGIFDPSQDAAGIYTYTVTGIAPCGEASATVTVAIIPAPNPGTNGSLTLCSNDVASNLFDSLNGTPETGGTWSPALASGTGVFDPAQDVAGIYTYTIPGISPCGAASATVNVTVNPKAEPGTNGSLTLCFDSAPEDLINSLGGTPETGGTWSPALASGTGVFDPSIDAAGTYTYNVSGVTPCGEATSTVTVTINPIPNAGTNGSLIVCSNDPSQDLFDSLEGTPDTGGIWSPALASGTGMFNPAQDVAGIYTYTVKGISPCGEASATVNVTVNPKAEPGTNGSLILCFDSAPEDLFNSLGGTPETGGIWTPALTSGTGIFDPAQDAAGTYTYSVAGITPCGEATSTVTVTVNPLPNAGTNGSLILCSNDPSQNLFNSLEGTPDAGGTWSPALASGTGIFNPAQDASGIYTYTVKGISPCGEASATVDVTVNPGGEVGTNTSLALCIDSAPQDLFDSLGGTPQVGGVWSPALASGTGVFDPALDAAGTYRYITGIPPCGDTISTVTVTVNPLANAGTNGNLIVCSNDASQDLFDSLNGTPDAGGTWSPALASGHGTFDPAKDLAGIYTYTVRGLSPCAPASATVTVTISPEANPGTNGTLVVCIDGTSQDLFTSLGGTPETGGVWTPALTSGTGVFNPLQDAAGTYTYTVSGIAPCGDASATVIVSIDQFPNAGDDQRLAICSNTVPQNLFLSLGDNAETGGTWSPALASGNGFFDPAKDAAGTYTYTVTNTCGTDTASVRVNVIPQPDINGLTLSANDICLGDTLNINLSGATQLADGNYNLDYSLSGANTTVQTLTVTITNGGTVITLPTSQLTAAGATTFSLLNLLDPITGCDTTSSTLPTVTFIIERAETPQLIENGDSFCIDDAPTIADLTNKLIGGELITWYDALENGTAYSAETPLVDGTTYYASNTTINGCSSDTRLAVTISIDRCEPLEIIIPDGFSPNGDNINDDFFIRNLSELYPNFQLQIYNRYGNILYKGDNNTPNWDGTSNQGREIGSGVLPVGIYYFILELKDTNNKTIQGRVYLNR